MGEQPGRSAAVSADPHPHAGEPVRAPAPPESAQASGLVEGGHRGRRLFVAALSLLVVVAAVALLADPEGTGYPIEAITTAVLFAAFTLGPILRGARPTSVWLVQFAAGLCFMATCHPGLRGASVGLLDAVDVPFLIGYALLTVWLHLLPLHVGGANLKLGFADSIAAGAGGLLTLWCILLIPLDDGNVMLSGFFWGVYPLIDLIILALASHLLFRMGWMAPAMAWLLTGAGLWLAVDSAYAWFAVENNDPDVPLLDAAYLLCHLCLALAATHPSILEFSRPPRVAGSGADADTKVVNLLFALWPLILCTLIPTTTLADGLLRTALVALIVAIVYMRIVRTMGALRRAEARTAEKATHDPLTGLFNRSVLMDHLTRSLARSEPGDRLAVFYFDCDHFKNVNDTWGHEAGDNLLRDIAHRLHTRLPETVLRVRQGGDEFVLVQAVASREEAAERARDLVAILREPAQILPDRTLAVTPSLGVVVTEPGEDLAVGDLLVRADLAMFEAKRAGGDRFVMFDDALRERMRLQAGVGTRLAAALADNRIDVALRPIAGGPGFTQIMGWEVLPRWYDEQLGAVAPELLVPVAESLGLGAQLGNSLLTRACRDVARMRALAPGSDLGIVVDVTSSQLHDPAFADKALSFCDDAGFPRGALLLRMGENVLSDLPPGAIAVLRDLTEGGVRLCVDDFGAGFASLAALAQLDLEVVRLSGAFTASAGATGESRRQMDALLALVSSLEVEQVIADGIDSAPRLDVIGRLGLPLAQGPLFGAPMSPEEAAAAMRAGGMVPGMPPPVAPVAPLPAGSAACGDATPA